MRNAFRLPIRSPPPISLVLYALAGSNPRALFGKIAGGLFGDITPIFFKMVRQLRKNFAKNLKKT